MSVEKTVTVTAQWTDGEGHFAEGNYQFAAQGDLMDSTTVAIVTPVIFGQLDTTGSLWDGVHTGSGVSLLASDNFAAGQLTWHVLCRIKGIPDIDVADVVIDYSNGASQGLFGILAANGWTPVTV